MSLEGLQIVVVVVVVAAVVVVVVGVAADEMLRDVNIYFASCFQYRRPLSSRTKPKLFSIFCFERPDF